MPQKSGIIVKKQKHESLEKYSRKLGKIVRPKKRRKEAFTSFWLKSPEKYYRQIRQKLGKILRKTWKNTPQKTVPGGRITFSNYACPNFV